MIDAPIAAIATPSSVSAPSTWTFNLYSAAADGSTDCHWRYSPSQTIARQARHTAIATPTAIVNQPIAVRRVCADRVSAISRESIHYTGRLRDLNFELQ